MILHDPDDPEMEKKGQRERGVLTVEVELDEWTLGLLRILGEPHEVLGRLVDHARQGVYRPGSWERRWLNQVFGDEWESRLERDPESHYFQRPKQNTGGEG